MIATSRTPIAATPMPILPLVLVFCRRVPIYLDLGVEDVLFGLDGLGADLRGELQLQARPLHLHDHRRRVRGRAGRERLRGVGGLRLAVGQTLDRLRQRAAEALAP